MSAILSPCGPHESSAVIALAKIEAARRTGRPGRRMKIWAWLPAVARAALAPSITEAAE